MEKKHILFCVTNDLNYDQRMIRICTSLNNNGYKITLIGVQKKNSPILQQKKFNQKRINVHFTKGKLFYFEYNIKLFFYLLFLKCDAICCIDLDTIVPVYFVSVLKRKKRIYDAHEYFSQLKEVVTRPYIYKIWHGIEKWFLPKFKNGYTVCESIENEFAKHYNVNYSIIRNMPFLKDDFALIKKEKIIIYQGAVNEGRCFEKLIPAMKTINCNLHIYGDGNFFEQTKILIEKYGVQSKVFLKGKFLPNELDNFTAQAYIGINLVEYTGLSQYYSLANKFFDYIHFSLPQITMNYPEYKLINDEYNIAVLIDEPTEIANAVNKLLIDDNLYNTLKLNCNAAKKVLNWQEEEKKLLAFYKKIFE